jgi:hypothetical protein
MLSTNQVDCPTVSAISLTNLVLGYAIIAYNKTVLLNRPVRTTRAKPAVLSNVSSKPRGYTLERLTKPPPRQLACAH